MMAMRIRPEEAVQREIIVYLDAVLPRALIMAIPNGARRTRTGRASNAIAGLCPGAPDLVVALPGGKVLWIEVKAPNGHASSSQIAIHSAMKALGHTCVIARSQDDVRRALVRLGVETREAMA